MDTPTTSAGYMLLFRDPWPKTYMDLPAEQREDCMDRWNDWFDGLVAAGQLEHGHPLIPKGRVVSAARDGRVVDGPFSEAKETIGGYFLLNVETLDEATEIARRCPLLEHGMIVEVREVAPCCPLATSIGRQTMKK